MHTVGGRPHPSRTGSFWAGQSCWCWNLLAFRAYTEAEKVGARGVTWLKPLQQMILCTMVHVWSSRHCGRRSGRSEEIKATRKAKACGSQHYGLENFSVMQDLLVWCASKVLARRTHRAFWRTNSAATFSEFGPRGFVGFGRVSNRRRMFLTLPGWQRNRHATEHNKASSESS